MGAWELWERLQCGRWADGSEEKAWKRKKAMRVGVVGCGNLLEEEDIYGKVAKTEMNGQ